MRLGIVMLAHEPLDRAAQTLRYWSEAGCAVVVHVDRGSDAATLARFVQLTSGLSGVHVLQDRLRCTWGSWSVVKASLRAADAMLKRFGDVTHVLLVSGTCIPLRPPRDLVMFLKDRPKTDFIESVEVAESSWSRGGFERERFQYRFPFSYRRHRRLFERLTALQRRFGLRRKPPAGLVPHLGSQWWCLTRETLLRILRDPDRRRLHQYFRSVWIPDESFFQSVVRRHTSGLESRSLTLSRFDAQGKPFVFYDDHVELLRQSGCFLARKAWPGADGLYRAFLTKPLSSTGLALPNPAEANRALDLSCVRKRSGRPGLYMQSRFPTRNADRQRSAAPYWVFWGAGGVFPDFDGWLADLSGATVHGHLFAPDAAHFSEASTVWSGCLPDSARLRDYNPCGFLTNLLWAGRGTRQCFRLGPADNLYTVDFIAGDPNARIIVVTGAWAMDLSRSNGTPAEIRRAAIELHRREQQVVDKLKAQWVRAQVGIWSLAEFLERPVPLLLSTLGETGLLRQGKPSQAPAVRDTLGLRAFLDQMRDSGINLDLVGDFTPILPVQSCQHPAQRFQVVR